MITNLYKIEQRLFVQYFNTSKYDMELKRYFFNLYLTAYFNNRNYE